MTDQSSPDNNDTALSFLLRVQEEPEDEALRNELQQWRESSPAHERAWQKILRVRMVGILALQASPQGDTSRAPFRAEDGKISPPRRSQWRGLAVAAAACLAIVSSVPQIRLWLQTDYSTRTGETQHIILADGSEAILGASSALDVHMDQTSRHITLLKGEALFRVKHDVNRTFVVQAGSVTSRDIGTVFDVRKSNGHVVLAVAEGVIGVTPSQSGSSKTEIAATELHLASGDQIDITEDSGQMRRSAIPSDSVGSWNSGIYGTNTASVNDMMSMLERYYPGYVFVRGRVPAEKLVGGVYDLRHPAESIRMLATSIGGSVHELAGHIMLVRFRD